MSETLTLGQAAPVRASIIEIDGKPMLWCSAPSCPGKIVDGKVECPCLAERTTLDIFAPRVAAAEAAIWREAAEIAEAEAERMRPMAEHSFLFRGAYGKARALAAIYRAKAEGRA